MMLTRSLGARARPSSGPLGPRAGSRPRSLAVAARVAQARREAAGQDGPAPADGAVQAAASVPDDYFLEPLLRSFLLGVGAGALVETGHVLLKFMGVAVASGPALLDALPNALPEFAPLFVWDHVAALGAWVLLYAVEAIAILAVLNQYPDDSQKADRTIRRMATPTKRMLPLKLSTAKRALYALTSLASRRPAAAAAAALVAPAPPALPPTAAAPAAFRDGSTATLERVIEEIEQDAAAAPRLPRGPQLPQVPEPPKAKGGPGLTERRRAAGLLPGQLDPSSTLPSGVGHRERELIDRKSYLRNFWYAAALSSALTDDAPLGVDILGGRVVLFRDQDGKAQCLDDWCPHRGAPLSGGQVKAHASGHTCVVCPYHGWAFDEEGRLRDVPSAEPDRWPKRPLVSSYPVTEAGGFVWLFFGSPDLPESERPPLPCSFVPELDAPGWHAVYGEIEFECGHWGVFENAIDMAHIHYLHSDSFGNQSAPRIHGMTASRPDCWHVESQFRIHNKPMNSMWAWTNTGDSVPVAARAMLPSTSAVTIELAHGVSMITFVNTVPITATRAVNRFCLIRNFLGWDGFDDYARSQMVKILTEDKAMVERLRPEALEREYSLSPDGPQVAFRKLRAEWMKLPGYASRHGLARAPSAGADAAVPRSGDM